MVLTTIVSRVTCMIVVIVFSRESLPVNVAVDVRELSLVGVRAIPRLFWACQEITEGLASPTYKAISFWNHLQHWYFASCSPVFRTFRRRYGAGMVEHLSRPV